MAHHTVKSGYIQLVDRVNRFPQGAPPSKLLYEILKMLFSKSEAGLVSLLPLRPFSAEKAAQIWEMDAGRTQNILDELCRRAILMDMEENGRRIVLWRPPVY